MSTDVEALPASWKPQSVVVITGASSGIGKALALEYSKRRCRLVLAARSTNKLQEIAQQCTANGSTVLVVPTDVSQMSQCKTLINKTMKKFGEIDLLVLNAGVSMHVPFDELEEKEMTKVFHDLMEVNYFGYVYCTYFALPHLKKTNGRVIVVSSLSGETGVPLRTGYCASKFAVNGFFEALRIELQGQVSITQISPGYVNTSIREHSYGPSDFHPVQSSSMMSSEECARLIVKHADRGTRKVVLGMSGRLVHYLRPFVPSAIDWVVRKKAYHSEQPTTAAESSEAPAAPAATHEEESSHKGRRKSAL